MTSVLVLHISTQFLDPVVMVRLGLSVFLFRQVESFLPEMLPEALEEQDDEGEDDEGGAQAHPGGLFRKAREGRAALASTEFVRKLVRRHSLQNRCELSDYSGCPSNHPDCAVRELQWRSAEMVLARHQSGLETANKRIESLRLSLTAGEAEVERLRQRREETEDAVTETQNEIQCLKDELAMIQKTMKSYEDDSDKLDKEISSFREQLDVQRAHSFFPSPDSGTCRASSLLESTNIVFKKTADVGKEKRRAVTKGQRS